MTELRTALLPDCSIGLAVNIATLFDRHSAGAFTIRRRRSCRGAALVLGLLAALSLPQTTLAAGAPEAFNARRVQLDLFARDSIQVIAHCELDKVFLEHRKLGFFRVKLLPLLVAEGVRVEFTQANPQTNWVEGFRFNPAPKIHARAMEWRDFRLFFPGEPSPRLRADRVIPAAAGTSAVCRLEGVQLATGGEPVQLARADLNETADGGAISWRTDDASVRWNLLTGQCITNSIHQSTSP